MKNIYLLAILLLLSGNVFAQKNIRIDQVREYGEEKLTSGLINDLVQDSYGFIWIATDYGLNKFDGIQFTHYLHNENDSTSLLSNNVRTLMMDSDSMLWIGCSKGVQYYLPDEDAFRTVSFADGEFPHITKMIELHTGEIWATTSGWGVLSIDRSAHTAKVLTKITELTKDDFASFIYEDKQHYVWFGVNGIGLVRIDPTTYRSMYFSVPDISHNNVTGIVEDDEGNFYMSTSIGLSFFDNHTQRFIPIEYADKGGLNILKLIKSKEGIIYVCTDGQGLKYLDKSTNKLRSITDKYSFVFDSSKVVALLEDADQNLWMGCFQEGIFMVPNHSTQFNFRQVVDKEHQRGKRIISMTGDYTGNFWCAVSGEGVWELSDEGKILNVFKDLGGISSLYKDSEQTIWATPNAGRQKLAKYDRDTGKFKPLDVVYGGYGKAMVEDLDKNLYISTFANGFIRYNIRTGSWKKYDMRGVDTGNGILDNDWINCMICDSEGLVWFGHYKGISCFDSKNNRFVQYDLSETLLEQICISLLEGSDGVIWIGTYNGLFCLNKNTKEIKRYTTDDGLSSNVICGLEKDDNGNIWCSTFKGISQLRLEEDRVVTYYSGNGLVDMVYSRGISFQDKHGIIYFAGNTGITSFCPGDVAISSYDNEVLVTNAYLYNRSININTLSGKNQVVTTGVLSAKEYKLAYEDKAITFEFSTMDFKDPENICYEYRLKELDSNWNSTLPGISQVTYNHLNPGKYTLEVRATKYGAYSPVKRLSLVISSPWYRSGIAYAMYLSFCLLLTALVANIIRKKRKEQINESRLQFFINISHEIRSPLTLIISPLEKLLKENSDAETRKALQGIHRNAIRILGLVNQLLDIRKFDKGLMKLRYSETEMIGFIKELFDVFEYQSSKRNIRFVFEHALEELTVWVDRDNFDKILMNILSNAFKYTPDGGEIIVSLQTGVDNESWGPLRKYVEIAVKDSGNGLDESKIDRIFDRFYQGQDQEGFTTTGSGIGLNLAKKLVRLHYGTITAANRKGVKGSCFTIRIPLGKEHLKKEEFKERVSDVRPMLQTVATVFDVEKQEKPLKRKTNYRVLIVDDEEEIRNYLVQELSTIYRTITAENGKEGLKKAIAQLPDLIISDVVMPQMNGLEFVKELRKNNNVSHIPTILLTSKIESGDRMKGLERGADAYLTKPFNIEELLITANNLITNRIMLKGKFSGSQDQEGRIKPLELKSNDEALMERITTVINDNIGNPELNVEMLASEVGLSRSQLHRRLKEMMGISTVDLIRNIRLRQAATLLREKKMDISQVAYAVGITNQTYFSTMFKKFYGVSPTEYIAQKEELE